MENILHIDDVETKDLFVKAFDGHEILLRWYWKRTSSPGSAVLYIHGGGMIYLSVEQYHKLLKVGFFPANQFQVNFACRHYNIL